MNLIERYLGRVLINHTLVVLVVLLIILGFSEFMIQLGKVDEDYTLAKGALYTLLKLPVYGYEIFPVALLIGTLIGLGGLANHAELTILRVTGWSVGRVFLGVMKTALLFWVVVAVMGEWVAPQAESYAKQMRGEALKKDFSIGSTNDFWMRDNDRFIHVAQVISDRVFYNVTIFTVENGQLNESIHAEKAEFEDGKWWLFNVRKNEIGLEQKHQTIDLPGKPPQDKTWQALRWNEQHWDKHPVSLPVNPELLQSLSVDTRYMGIYDLYRYINFLERNRLDAEPYQLAFWRKVAMPFVIIGMIALVFPLIFGSQRQVSMGQRIFVGILIGMSFHLMNQIFGNLIVVYHLSALLGAFLPSLMLLMVAVILFSRLR